MLTKEFIKNSLSMPLLACLYSDKLCKFVEVIDDNFYCHGSNQKEPRIMSKKVFVSCPLNK